MTASERKKESISSPEKIESTTKASDTPMRKYFGWIKRESVTEFEVFLLGVSLVMGTQNSGFGTVYSRGYWDAFFNFLWVGSGYVALALCLAEISSALPFSGGIYGFVRAAIGPYYGFMAACLETLFNITYVSEISRTAAMIPIHCQVLPLSAAPWLVFLFYLFNYLLCLVGGRPFWTLAFIIGATSFALMMIYMFGTLAAINTPAVDYNHFCVSTAKFSFLSVLSHRAAAGNQFRGIHYLPLNSDYLKDPKKQMPRLILATIIIIFLNVNFLGIAVCSQAPGIAQLPQVTYPLRNGWARIFNTDLNVGRWLHLPGLLISCLGFIYSAGKQLNSIAESGFLPKAFTHTIPIIDTPYFCLTLSTCFSFMLSMLMVKYPDIIDDASTIPSLSMQFICINAFVCYIIFRTKFSNLTKSFESPIGIWGAVYGILNNVIGMISNIFFIGHNYTGITVIIILCTISTLIYVFYVSKNQKFSEEEKKVLFKAYLINANQANRKKMRKNKVGPDDSKNNNSSSHGDQKNGTNRQTKDSSQLKNSTLQGTKVTTITSDTGSNHFPPLFNRGTVCPMPISIQEEGIDVENQAKSLKAPPTPSLTCLTDRNHEEEPSNLPEFTNDQLISSLNYGNRFNLSPLEITRQSMEINPQVIAPANHSTKLLDRISSKFSELKQSFQMDPEELKEYSQLMILKSGGEIDSHEMENIQEKYQLVFPMNNHHELLLPLSTENV